MCLKSQIEIEPHLIPVYTSLAVISLYRAHRTRDEIMANKGSAQSLICDFSDLQATQEKLNEFVKHFPIQKIGLILASAMVGPKGPIYATSLNSWDETIRTNLIGNLAVYQAFHQHLLQEKFGRIIFFSGGGGAYAFPEFPAYAASKTATIRTVENLHIELKSKGNFAVIALAPGAIDTDMLRVVKAAGAKIRTETSIDKPVLFAEKFMSAASCHFSGCLVHVNDDWEKYLNSSQQLPHDSHWTLRRIED